MFKMVCLLSAKTAVAALAVAAAAVATPFESPRLRRRSTS
jgi:hypothetical protein